MSRLRPGRLAGQLALQLCCLSVLADDVTHSCRLDGSFYQSGNWSLARCLRTCEADPQCGGFSWKHTNGTSPTVTRTVNCTGQSGQPCCYLQSSTAVSGTAQDAQFSCWAKPGTARFTVGETGSAFSHYWEAGINSPHSALTLRADYQSQMRQLRRDIGYQFTRIHAPFSRDYSVAQGPNAVSYFNAFATYDFLLSIGMKPWIELGYTPCWMSGRPAVPPDSYWPTVDYGLCVGSPDTMEHWTDLISGYVGAMIDRYGLEEVESWVWVLFNEPAGVNAFSAEWQTGQGSFSYYDLFFNTSAAIKAHSRGITFGGLSDSPDQAAALMAESAGRSDRAGAFDLFTYHYYCNSFATGAACGDAQQAVAAKLRSVLPQGMPIYLEETGSSAGPYTPFHDTTAEVSTCTCS